MERKRGYRFLVAACGVALATLAGCSSGTEPSPKPTQVRVEVQGTVAGPLRLVVSNDFTEGADTDTGLDLHQADTASFAPPYDHTYPLAASGSVVIELTNVGDRGGQVTLRITLDNGEEPFEKSTDLSPGEPLRFVYRHQAF
jgi:hypothetical protein